MRLSISGTAAQGKTTLLNEMLGKWDMYTTAKHTYRDVIKKANKGKKKHSKYTDKDTQWAILNQMIDEIMKYKADDHVIFDRCPLDNLIYSMWSFHKSVSDIDEQFIEKCIPLVRNSMKFLDIIFFVPITNAAPGEIEDNGERETDAEYIKEIDNLFKAMYNNWAKEDERFFPKEDRTAMIEVFGTTEQRLTMLGYYINDEGKMYGDEDSLVDTNTIVDQYGFPTGSDTEEQDFRMYE